ncbi:MAG: hypothetical protein QOH23_1837 [Gaiellaceae bacterium]|jgi:hypothetical protein|nr:hypothetical protein [Gaiellaceae bacterium]
MPVLIRYAPAGLTKPQYDQVGEKLQAKGQWPPDGLILHVGFGADGDMRVSEVWESREKLEAFQQQHLMPLLQEAGVDVEGNEPETFEVHGIESVKYSTTT